MSSDSSDLEIHTVLKKNVKKTRQLPEHLIVKDEKKLSTKDMIYQALEQSKSRKGISLHAIKKYIEETFSADTEKINYLIKKALKAGVETGTFVQTKGTGASGSFKLAPKSKEAKKEVEKPKTTTVKVESKSKVTKSKKEVEKSDNERKKSKKVMIEEPEKKKKKLKETKPKPGTSKMTPMKRKNMMKRKSIGSIIKPPKMKPKANG